MHLKEIMKMQAAFDQAHAVSKDFYTPIDESNLEELEHLVVCVLGELGEFANVLKKMTRGDLAYKSGRPLLEEELVDIFIYVIKIAEQFEVDLEQGFQQKVRKNSQRFQAWEKK